MKVSSINLLNGCNNLQVIVVVVVVVGVGVCWLWFSGGLGLAHFATDYLYLVYKRIQKTNIKMKNNIKERVAKQDI